MAESTELQVIVSMVDKISDNLKAIETNMESFSDNARKVGTAFTAAGGVIAAGLGATVLAAADAEKAQRQLEHATLNVAKASEEELKALENTAAALQAKGVLDGDNIKMGQAQLMTFGISAQMANDLSGSLADLAVNQFGVNASGDQLTQTANMVAKALNGQFGVLEKSGIRFTEAQQQMIQFGTETERTAALQEGLAQNLKFTNEVALTTFEGQLAKTKTMLGDTAEQIGGMLLPVVMELAQKIQPVIENIMTWISENESLVEKIVIGTAAVGALLLILGPFLIVLSTLPALIGGVTAALGLVSTAVTAFGTVLTFLAANPIVLIIAAIAAIGVAIYLLIKNWDEVKETLLWTWDLLKERFGVFVENIVNMVSNFTSNILDKIKGFVDAYIGFWSGLFEKVGNILKTAIDLYVSFWTGLFNTVIGAIQSFNDMVIGAWTSVWNGLANIASNAFNGVIDAIKAGINLAISAINGFINGVNSTADVADIIPGVSIPDIPNIPMLAKGGIVTKPTLAMIGEAGTEAVIPLNRSNTPNLAPNITVVVEGSIIKQSDLVKEVGDELVDYLKLSSAVVG